MSAFDVEINNVSMKVLLLGVTSFKQSQCCVPLQPVSLFQSTPVSASGLANTSTAKACVTTAVAIIGIRKNRKRSLGVTKLFFLDLLTLHFHLIELNIVCHG